MKNIELEYTEINDILVPNIQISNDIEDDIQPLGKYGRMAMDYLYKHNRYNFTLYKMQGTLMKKMHDVDKEVKEKIEDIIQKLLKQSPIPNTDDIPERTRHLNSLKETAEEIILKELVLISR